MLVTSSYAVLIDQTSEQSVSWGGHIFLFSVSSQIIPPTQHKSINPLDL